MSRLTEKNAIAVCGHCNSWDICKPDDTCFVKEVYKKLHHYEDLEEQGRLIEQKHGYWTGSDGYDCSECGESYMEVADADAYASGWKPNYCPNCGAKMDEVK